MQCDSLTIRQKTARGAGTSRLRQQAAVLGRARHPGVVELLDVVDDGSTVTVVTTAVAGVRLGEAELAPAEAAGVLAVVATTVADLHDIGLAHGDVRADNVIVGLDGRPVLDGFDEATVLDGPPRHWPTSPAALADVAALGHLAAELAQRTCGPGPARTPHDRGSRHRRSAGGDRGAAEVLADLARRAESPATRWRAGQGLTARALADRIVTDIPQARLPGGHTDSRSPGSSLPVAAFDASDEVAGGLADADSPRDTRASRRRVAADFVAARWPTLRAVAAAVVVTLVAVLFSTARFRHAPPSMSRRSSNEPTGAATARTTGPMTLAPVVSPSGARSDRQPLPGGATFGSGVLTIGPRQYTLGQPGDVIAIGHWLCQPTATVALLRPTTAQIWVFSSWPTVSTAITASAVGSVPGGQAIRARAVGPCDELLVDRITGPAIALRPWSMP